MKVRIYASLLVFMMTVTAVNVNATNIYDRKPKSEKFADMTKEQKEARLEEIKDRVSEIKAMDKSALTKADRKAMKKELKGMNKEARAMSGGVYLSVGAIIIIILLLILIL